MRHVFKTIWAWIYARIHQFLQKKIDVSESNEVIKIVTKNIGLAWVQMENHVRIHNRFIVPYQILEVKLTYYNDANQNIGYLHFKGPVRMGGFSSQVVKMPSKMSNITALFNVARLLVVDHIKTRTVGTTTIRLLGMTFVLPVDDIMIVDKDKIVTEEMDAAEKERKQREREEREQYRKARREERRRKREERQRAMEQARLERREKAMARRTEKRNLAGTAMSGSPETEQEPAATPKTPAKNLSKEVAATEEEEESSAPDQDKSYPDPSA